MNTIILKHPGDFRRIKYPHNLPDIWIEPAPTGPIVGWEGPDGRYHPLKERRWRLVDRIKIGKREVGYYELVPDSKP